jgi:hypothetical protein
MYWELLLFLKITRISKHPIKLIKYNFLLYYSPISHMDLALPRQDHAQPKFYPFVSVLQSGSSLFGVLSRRLRVNQVSTAAELRARSLQPKLIWSTSPLVPLICSVLLRFVWGDGHPFLAAAPGRDRATARTQGRLHSGRRRGRQQFTITEIQSSNDKWKKKI